MAQDSQTRDRIRALVRDVLENAQDAPTGMTGTEDKSTANLTQIAPSSSPISLAASIPSTRTIDLASDARTSSDETVARDESSKTIITELDLRDLPEGSRVRVREGVRFTDLASDIIRERNIELVRRPPRSSSPSAIRSIAIGADHGGFETKQELQRFLTEQGHRVRDHGTHSTDAVDYPDIAHAVAQTVAHGEADLGIIIDGAGIGSAMTANKVPGIRAAACYSVALARNSREHNGANVLTLGSTINTFDEIREIVKTWLASELREERHRKRVAKIEAIGRQYVTSGG